MKVMQKMHDSVPPPQKKRANYVHSTPFTAMGKLILPDPNADFDDANDDGPEDANEGDTDDPDDDDEEDQHVDVDCSFVPPLFSLALSPIQ